MKKIKDILVKETEFKVQTFRHLVSEIDTKNLVIDILKEASNKQIDVEKYLKSKNEYDIVKIRNEDGVDNYLNSKKVKWDNKIVGSSGAIIYELKGKVVAVWLGKKEQWLNIK